MHELSDLGWKAQALAPLFQLFAPTRGLGRLLSIGNMLTQAGRVFTDRDADSAISAAAALIAGGPMRPSQKLPSGPAKSGVGAGGGVIEAPNTNTFHFPFGSANKSSTIRAVTPSSTPAPQNWNPANNREWEGLYQPNALGVVVTSANVNRDFGSRNRDGLTDNVYKNIAADEVRKLLNSGLGWQPPKSSSKRKQPQTPPPPPPPPKPESLIQVQGPNGQRINMPWYDGQLPPRRDIDDLVDFKAFRLIPAAPTSASTDFNDVAQNAAQVASMSPSNLGQALATISTLSRNASNIGQNITGQIGMIDSGKLSRFPRPDGTMSVQLIGEPFYLKKSSVPGWSKVGVNLAIGAGAYSPQFGGWGDTPDGYNPVGNLYSAIRGLPAIDQSEYEHPYTGIIPQEVAGRANPDYYIPKRGDIPIGHRFAWSFLTPEERIRTIEMIKGKRGNELDYGQAGQIFTDREIARQYFEGR